MPLLYVLPDTAHANVMVTDLKPMGIRPRQIHAVVASKQNLQGLEDVHQLHDLDRLKWIEWLLLPVGVMLQNFAGTMAHKVPVYRSFSHLFYSR